MSVGIQANAAPVAGANNAPVPLQPLPTCSKRVRVAAVALAIFSAIALAVSVSHHPLAIAAHSIVGGATVLSGIAIVGIISSLAIAIFFVAYNLKANAILKQKLDQWVLTGGLPTSQANRQIAADQILYAFLHDRTALMIADLNLTNLPKEIGYLTNLEWLNLSRNQLTELPPEVRSLTNLKDISLSHNRLTELTPEIGSLTNLESLTLSHNQLTALPQEIISLTKLVWLDLSRNTNFTSLPMTLANCSQLTHLNIEGTQIPSAMRDGIVNRAQAARLAGCFLTLPSRVATWKSYGNVDYDFQFLSDEQKFSHEQQGQIGEWLLRLELCQDFQHKRAELANLVCRMLKALDDSPQFKDAFFAKIAENLDRCDDRASMLLNMIYTDFRMYITDPYATNNEKFALLEGIAKTLALRKALESMIANYERTNDILGESVEIFLYYETRLKDRLKLVTAIENMHYAEMGSAPNVVDETQLVAAVEESFSRILASLDGLDKILEKDQNYMMAKTKIEEETSAEMELVEKQVEDDNWDKIKFPNYVDAMNAVRDKRDLALAALKLQHVQRIPGTN